MHLAAGLDTMTLVGRYVTPHLGAYEGTPGPVGVHLHMDALNLAHLSAAEKQHLLARLLRDKVRQQSTAQAPPAVMDWTQDAQLDPRLHALGSTAYPEAPQQILLTGATGFLGAHLLQEWLACSAATVVCLVRAPDETAARQRLQTNWARYFAQPLDWQRVRLVVGDLAQPHLGLAPQVYAALAQDIELIVHNAAQLHHLAPYAQLKVNNVDSTVALLQLATTVRPKWLHYISTLVAAVDCDSAGWLLEEGPRAAPVGLVGGYTQSKWVSEQLVTQAAQRGIGVTIFRPGFISGRRDTGAWPVENDHLLRLLKGCVQMGVAPASALVLDMAPVDCISAAIVRLGLRPSRSGQVYNLANPPALPWTTLVGWLQESGYAVRLVPETVWRAQHLQHLEPENALFPILPLYLGGETTERHIGLLSKLARVRRDATAQRLAEVPLALPVVDQALWRRYVAFLQASGFLPAPG